MRLIPRPRTVFRLLGVALIAAGLLMSGNPAMQALAARVPLVAVHLPGSQPNGVRDLPTRDARMLLGQLAVAKANKSGYSRDLFNHWTDDDDDGCDTRREVIIAEARKAPRVSSGCRIDAGTWVSVYDRKRTTGYPADYDVDHLVPLAEAFGSGARDWPADRRTAFANDTTRPESLILVTASTNRTKSDKDPAAWMPPNKSAWCGYAADWVRVKYQWSLTVDPTEQRTLARLLTHCQGTETLVRG